MSNRPTHCGKIVRIQTSQRRQIEFRPWSLDQLIPSGHRVRADWSYMESLDLSSLYEAIESVEGKRGLKNSNFKPVIVLVV